MSAKPWPVQGIHYGIAPSTYFAPQPQDLRDWIVSKSVLWDFAKNPRRWRESPPKTITEAMRWGSLVDCLALTPERFDASYVLQPETYVSKPEGEILLTTAYEGEWNGRTKACREWKTAREAEGKTVFTPEELEKASEPKPWNWNSTTCQKWREALPRGVEIVSTDTLTEARTARAKLFTRAEVAEMLSGDARTQVAMRYDFLEIIHGISGMVLPAKGLIDIVPDKAGAWGDSLVDLKTTGKLDYLDQVEKTIYTMGYHAQAALYLDMWNALTGEDREGFVFVFQLAVAPYEVAVVELAPDAIVAGREWYLAAVKRWAQTITSGKWESPWDGVKSAKLPAWAGRNAA